MGKKQTFNYLFFTIFCSLIIFSIISNFIKFHENIQQTITISNFTVTDILANLIMCFLFLFLTFNSIETKLITKKVILYRIIMTLTITLVILLLSYLYNFLNLHYSFKHMPTEFFKPENFYQCTILFVGIIVSAIFEELAYRLYIPQTMNTLLNTKYNKIISIIVSSILFSFGHIHNGILGVIHSFLASLCLFFLFNKTKTITTSCAAHVIHNIILTIISLI